MDPRWHGKDGQFDGRRAGPGRPKGIPNFEAALRRVLSKGADKFAERFEQLLADGDATAWRLAMERAYVKPPAEVDLTSDGGPVAFGWRAAEPPAAAAPPNVEAEPPVDNPSPEGADITSDPEPEA